MEQRKITRRGFVAATGAGAFLPAISRSRGEQRQRQRSSSDPDLETLREKWFLSFDGDDVAFPPSDRHSGSTLEPYVSASVEPLYDGASFMEQWYETVTDMTDHHPSESELYHSTWHLGDVPLLGANRWDTQATDVLDDADAAGVDVHAMISGNIDQFISDTATSWGLGIDTVAIDTRYPAAGSNHQKLSIFNSPDVTAATVGSADLYADRWGRRPHDPKDPDRPDVPPNHDLTVWLEGPIVRELQKVYLERWNDESRDNWLGDLGRGWTPPTIDPDPIETGTGGSQQVQILQTYGQTSRRGYSWSEEGEFTVWAAYKQALKQASDYAYIECQFFQPEGATPWFEEHGTQREASLFYQMAQALRRGVDVIVVTVRESGFDILEEHRRQGIEYLRSVDATAPGDFEIAYLSNGVEPIYVHSKLLMIDDEVTYIGSANVNRRSMSHDGELQLAIIDEDNEFTREMRTELWRGHLGISPEHADQELADPGDGVEAFKDGIRNDTGLLRSMPSRSGGLNIAQRPLFNTFYDPYGGPDHGDLGQIDDRCLVTEPAEDIGETSATFVAAVKECLEELQDAYGPLQFAYKPVGAEEIQFTPSRTVTSAGRFEETVEDLQPNTTYEYMVAFDNEEPWIPPAIHGGWREFETEDDSDGFSIPGFTVPAAAAGVGSGALLYKYYLDEDEEDGSPDS